MKIGLAEGHDLAQLQHVSDRRGSRLAAVRVRRDVVDRGHGMTWHKTLRSAILDRIEHFGRVVFQRRALENHVQEDIRIDEQLHRFLLRFGRGSATRLPPCFSRRYCL
jgi:hypothetical protein